jgi:hypothetical protein
VTASPPHSQPKISELLVELRHHEADYPELIHGPLCGQAADRIEELEAALRDALCELSACAIQMNVRTGGSVHRAQERARATLQSEKTP